MSSVCSQFLIARIILLTYHALTKGILPVPPCPVILYGLRLQTMMALLAAERDFVVVTTGEEAPGPGTWDIIFNRASHSHLT